MSYFVIILGCLLFSAILVCFGWRLASRRHTIPCPSWLSFLVERDNPFVRENKAAAIISRANIESGMTVLDIGCGPGRVSVPLAQAVGDTGQVVALDCQSEMLKKAQAKAQCANLHNIAFIHATLGETSNRMAADQFDRVFLICVLGEVPNQAPLFDEIIRVLKPGGLLIVTELIFDPHFQSQKKVLALACDSGFSKPRCFGKRFAYTMTLEKPFHTAG